ncbi:MAG: type II toxin-antitoxin system VapB family antitoxin [Parvularculaceae bacterium]
MALSIKTEEADRLARKLAAATGETMTEAVTRALEERLERVTARGKASKRDLAADILKAAAQLRKELKLRTVTKQEWDDLWGA